MCIIIGIVKKKDATIKSQDAIIQSAINAQKANANGSSFVAWKGGKVKQLRSMKFTEQEIAEAVYENRRVVFHFRIATAGSVQLKNCHLWDKEGWYFAHNGFASIKSKNDNADSFEVMQELFKNGAVGKKKVKIDVVEKVYDKTGLTGKTIFVKPRHDKIVITGDYNFYGIDGNILAFASGNLDIVHRKKLFGFRFEEKSGIEVMTGKDSGVSVFENGMFKKISDNNPAGNGFGYGYGYGYYSRGYYEGYDDFGQSKCGGVPYNKDFPAPMQKTLPLKTIKLKENKPAVDAIEEAFDEDYDKMVEKEVEETLKQRGEWKKYPAS